MADQEFERDDKLIEARRLKRMELQHKRTVRQRITYGVLLLILVLIIVLIAKSCGKENPPAQPQNNSPQAGETQPATGEDSAKATLSAVGDIMIYDTQLENAKKTDGTYNFLPCFAPVTDLLTASDLTVGNFEANFAGEPYSGYPDFKAPESLATTLSGMGFDILQTANTYSIQNGLSGLSSTISTIRNEGMSSLGTYLSADDKQVNQVVVKDVNGIRIAFIGFTKGVNNLSLPEGSEYCVDLLYKDYATTYQSIDKDAITKAIGAAKEKDPDVIVAMLHWGSEYEAEPSTSQDEIADLMFQNGVDVILGSHSHIVGPMEKRTVTVDGKSKDVFIAYSLGNFLSSMTKNYTQESVILNLEFTKEDGETTISNVDYVPLYIMDNGEAAVNRYEIQNIYSVLASQPDDATKERMNTALQDLASNTGSDFARTDSSTATPSGTATQDGDTTTPETTGQDTTATDSAAQNSSQTQGDSQ